MNSLLDEIEQGERPRPAVSRGGSGEREITLGTTMILLIFFALAVYGAVVFGFGYSLGSKRSAGSATAVASGTAGSSTFGAFKPAPGSPAGSTPGGAPGPGKAQLDDFKPTPFTPPAATRATPAAGAAGSSGATIGIDPPSRPVPLPTATVPLPEAAAIATGPGPGVVVQVAALSHQEDAELIASTLQHRGYTVNLHAEADKLIHVQVGPFASRKDAESMKARLLADGFNAYIK